MKKQKTLAEIKDELKKEIERPKAINASVNDNAWYIRGKRIGELIGKLEGIELAEKELDEQLEQMYNAGKAKVENEMADWLEYKAMETYTDGLKSGLYVMLTDMIENKIKELRAGK